MKSFLIILLASFISCSAQPQSTSIIKFGSISLTIKNEDKFYLLTSSIDSKVSHIVINNGHDTLHLEYGSYKIIYKGFTSGRTIFSSETRNKMIKDNRELPPNDEVFFSDFQDEDIAQNIDDPLYYRYDTINNLIGKMFLPKVVGISHTGFFIPKLPDGKAFSIYGNNLSIDAQNETIELIKSTKFNEK